MTLAGKMLHVLPGQVRIRVALMSLISDIMSVDQILVHNWPEELLCAEPLEALEPQTFHFL